MAELRGDCEERNNGGTSDPVNTGRWEQDGVAKTSPDLPTPPPVPRPLHQEIFAEGPALESSPPDRQAEPPALPPLPPEHFWDTFRGRTVASLILCAIATVLLIAGFYDLRLERRVDKRLETGPFTGTIGVYASPRVIAEGDEVTPEDITAMLRRAGYTANAGNAIGWYRVRPEVVEIYPGRESAGMESGIVHCEDGSVASIVSLQDHTERRFLQLQPELLTSSSANREKRRLVHFNEIPPSLVHAIVSAEDKHFFQHSGVDLFRMAKAAYVDLRSGRKEQGASTLTMQLARQLWLDPDKNWKRKLQELLITLHLEERLTKQQIFEYYANSVYLGRRGTFTISGVAEAAHAYFGKDLSQIGPAEAALLAGLIQRPSYFNPVRYPDRAKERRNVVLALMYQNGYLTEPEYRNAVVSPMRIAAEQPDSFDGQYFVDLMTDELQNRMGDREEHARNVYTTLDPDLQKAAEEAVHMGMKYVDRQVARRRPAPPPGQPQVALIALDPRTGEIKALVGGRHYATSQLNRVIRMRQPGSVFKPFVYAAALDTAVEGAQQILTPASVVDDSPTSFRFGRQIYEPGNFHDNYMGSVTLRTAFMHSLNIAAVQVAQRVGYDRVVAMARRAGLNSGIKPTPAVALGAYETTPLEIAGAYTTFANHGIRTKPTTISMVRAADGTVLYQHDPDSRPVLDPRVTYLIVSMMEDVLRGGTGSGVRARGFSLPAAGKTGTSHDGWFAGFTSELLCVVWVGFDDNRDLDLQGAHSALPIWAEFMKRASQFPRYRDAQQFRPPAGVTTEEICTESGQRAGPYCPETRAEVFISGTAPATDCRIHRGFADRVASEDEDAPQIIRPIDRQDQPDH
jgi:penicillin-binding protein 1B